MSAKKPPQMDLFRPVRGKAGRNRALSAFEIYRSHVVELLRSAAWAAWYATEKPVSVNDVRHILIEEQYVEHGGDPRVLGSAFPARDWVRAGEGRTDSPLANTRAIRLFVPRDPTPRARE